MCHLSRKQKIWDLLSHPKVLFKTTTRGRLNVHLRGTDVVYLTNNKNELEKSILHGRNGQIFNFGEEINITLNLPSQTVVEVELVPYSEEDLAMGYICLIEYNEISYTFTVRGGQKKNDLVEHKDGVAEIKLFYF